MRTLIALLLVIALLAVAGAALAQSSGAGPGQSLSVQPGTSSGGNYQLVSLPLRQAQGDAWSVSGAAAGGDYTLAVPYTAAPRGSGCCCTYLPCILRNW
jgi:hypothetical protein